MAGEMLFLPREDNTLKNGAKAAVEGTADLREKAVYGGVVMGQLTSNRNDQDVPPEYWLPLILVGGALIALTRYATRSSPDTDSDSLKALRDKADGAVYYNPRTGLAIHTDPGDQSASPNLIVTRGGVSAGFVDSELVDMLTAPELEAAVNAGKTRERDIVLERRREMARKVIDEALSEAADLTPANIRKIKNAARRRAGFPTK